MPGLSHVLRCRILVSGIPSDGPTLDFRERFTVLHSWANPTGIFSDGLSVRIFHQTSVRINSGSLHYRMAAVLLGRHIMDAVIDVTVFCIVFSRCFLLFHFLNFLPSWSAGVPPGPEMMDHLLYLVGTSGRPATDVARDMMPASTDADPTICQFTSPIAAAVPIVATNVCAIVLTALRAAALAHCTVFTSGLNTQFLNIKSPPLADNLR